MPPCVPHWSPGDGTNKWHFVLPEYVLGCDGVQSSSSTLSRKKKLHFIKGWWALHCDYSVWSGSGRPKPVAAQQSYEGNPMTWAFFWLEFMLFAHFGPLCCKMVLNRTGCARLGQELMCEEWAWNDQLSEGNFKLDHSVVMRSKAGTQGGGQWDAGQEEEDTEIISTAETAWSIENRYSSRNATSKPAVSSCITGNGGISRLLVFLHLFSSLNFSCSIRKHVIILWDFNYCQLA